MKKPQTVAADGVLKNTSEYPNLIDRPEKNNQVEKITSTDATVLASRDARAMVHMLNRIRGGMESYEVIYESLRRLHGPVFDQHFRDVLAQKEGESINE